MYPVTQPNPESFGGTNSKRQQALSGLTRQESDYASSLLEATANPDVCKVCFFLIKFMHVL